MGLNNTSKIWENFKEKSLQKKESQTPRANNEIPFYNNHPGSFTNTFLRNAENPQNVSRTRSKSKEVSRIFNFEDTDD